MNVFTDFTFDLTHYYSLHALFEKRLKMNLFRPIGEEWRARGFQFCDFNNPDPAKLEDGVYHIPVQMPEEGYYAQNAITFQQFLKMDFDFIVTIYAAHEEPFYNLAKTYKPNTVFIRQVGNIHEKPLGFCKNFLLATCEPMPPEINWIMYYPELYEGYRYTPPSNHNTINNFVHDLPYYSIDVAAFYDFEHALTEFIFKMHGHDGRDGVIPYLLMPEAIKQSAFVWHVKAHGGAGFALRQALAVGRPCIVRKKYMLTHNANEQYLVEDSVNCIDLDRGREKAIALIRAWAQPDIHREVCKRIAEKFQNDVNYAAAAERIDAWMNSLKKGIC